MRKNWREKILIMTLLCAATAVVSPAQTFTTLATFDQTDGELPEGSLVQGMDGNLYGTTVDGGGNGGGGGGGTVFRITPAGELTTLYSFCRLLNCADGAFPYAGLILGTDGNLYGTTFGGGANGVGFGGDGTVFTISPGGELKTLYSFCSQTNCTDGSFPQDSLVQAANGDFYGTTRDGGVNGAGSGGYGTVFEITPSGTLATLYSFCSQANCADGRYPHAGLVQATNGGFMGPPMRAN
jgi:uncharacterized repeat protein (TIGR03803 family)